MASLFDAALERTRLPLVTSSTDWTALDTAANETNSANVGWLQVFYGAPVVCPELNEGAAATLPLGQVGTGALPCCRGRKKKRTP